MKEPTVYILQDENGSPKTMVDAAEVMNNYKRWRLLMWMWIVQGAAWLAVAGVEAWVLSH